MKKFSNLNKLEDHFKIHIVKPLKNNPALFQVFASVSPVMREGFKEFQDKVIIGLKTCKVYDRVQVKRCFSCQGFDHYIKDCPSELHCGKCTGSHKTADCTSDERKCINCVKNKVQDVNHSVFFHDCPSLHKHQQQLKENYLNMRGKTLNNPT